MNGQRGHESCADGLPAITAISDVDEAVRNDRSAVVHARNRGEFWKPCPGTTKGYLCCGYQILTPATGCGMYCRYCILQTYFGHRCQVVFDNIDDMEREVRERLAERRSVVRVGTGEFGDSLFLDPRLGLSKRIADLLLPYPRVVVEFKTKSANVRQLARIRNKRQVVTGFSLNTPRMIGLLEQGTASLDERLSAAAWCEQQGFWVAFHFDPMIFYPEWETEYRDVVRGIFSFVQDPGKIAWVSMGGFRTMPALKKLLRERGAHLPLFSGEQVLGEDRKLRYFKPVRVAFYRAMQEEFARCWTDTTLYLCMESPEVWDAAGMRHRIPQGLASYLDARAEQMLEGASEGRRIRT